MADRWMKQVYSSNVREVGYDPDSQEMLVKWKNGKTSAYAGVSEDKAIEVANAPSVGGIIHSEIRDQYSHRYV